MSPAWEDSESIHGFSSLTRGSQVCDVDLNSEVESESTTSSSAETESDHDMESRLSIRRRLTFSFHPSSDNDYPNRLKSDAAEVISPQIKKVPVSAKKGEEAEDEEAKKTWNLRPRKRGNGVFPAETWGGGANQQSGGGMELRSNRQRRFPAESFGSGGVEVTKESPRLWVSLSREEIEEDLFIMSGNKPSRRPRKRSKTLQKQLNAISPGSCLVGKNADCFRVSKSPAKR